MRNLKTLSILSKEFKSDERCFSPHHRDDDRCVHGRPMPRLSLENWLLLLAATAREFYVISRPLPTFLPVLLSIPLPCRCTARTRARTITTNRRVGASREETNTNSPHSLRSNFASMNETLASPFPGPRDSGNAFRPTSNGSHCPHPWFVSDKELPIWKCQLWVSGTSNTRGVVSGSYELPPPTTPQLAWNVSRLLGLRDDEMTDIPGYSPNLSASLQRLMTSYQPLFCFYLALRSNSAFSQTLAGNCMSEVMGIGSIIIFYLSWVAMKSQIFSTQSRVAGRGIRGHASPGSLNLKMH